jgi:hypothetical protein
MVGISTDRRAVEVTWSAGDSASDVHLRLTRGDDISETPFAKNDGRAPVTYPSDFTGVTHVEVLDVDGNLIDSGDITV